MERTKWLLPLVVVLGLFYTSVSTTGVVTGSSASLGMSGGFYIDLTPPGVTVSSGLQNVIPSVLAAIQSELKVKNAVTLSFVVAMPQNQAVSYMSEAQQEVLASISPYFPDCQISIRSTPKMDFWGYISQITFEVSLSRGNAVIPTPAPIGDDLSGFLDLSPSQSQKRIVMEFRKTILRLLPQIKKTLRVSNEASFSLSVRVPINSNPGFIQTLQANLIVQLTKYLPRQNIQLSSTSKEVDGYSKDVIFIVTARKECCEKIPGESIAIISMNWSPGVHIEAELAKYLPTYIQKLQTIYRGGNTASFGIKLSTKAVLTNNVLNDIKDQFVVALAKYFPDTKMMVRLEVTGDGITVLVDLHPSNDVSDPDLPYYEINLKRTGADLTTELVNLFKRILPQTPSEFKKPFTFNLLLIPPQLVDVNYVDQVAAKITQVVRNKFPRCNVMIDANVKENSWGGVENIIFEALLQPNSNMPEDLVELERFQVDMAKAPELLLLDIKHFLLRLKIRIDLEILKKGHRALLNFEIKPRKGATKWDLKELSILIMSLVVIEFPNSKIDQQDRLVADQEGNIKSAEICITIHPDKRGVAMEKVLIPDTFRVDISLPGSSLQNIMSIDVMSKLFDYIGDSSGSGHNIGDSSASGHRYQIEFVIKAPQGSDERSLQKSISEIVDNVVDFFPEFYVEYVAHITKNIITKVIEDVKLQVVLAPGRSSTGIAAPAISMTYPVPKSAQPILLSIYKWLQSNVVGIFKQLNKAPVILEFKVEPIILHKMEYAQETLEKIKELMINTFNHCNIGIGVTGVTDKLGCIKELIITVKLEARNVVDVQENPITVVPVVPVIPQVPTPVIPINPVVPPPSDGKPQRPVPPPPNVPSIPSPPVKPPGIKLPSVEITLPPGSDLEKIIRPGINKIIIDIMDELSKGGRANVEYFINFPTGTTNKFDLKGMIDVIKAIYQQQFPNYNVHCKVGDIEGKDNYVVSAVFTIFMEPIEYPRLILSTISPGASIGEVFKQKLPEIKNILKNVNVDGKSGIELIIPRQQGESAEYISQVIQELITIIQSVSPGTSFSLELDLSDSSNLGFIYKLVPARPNAPENGLFEIRVITDRQNLDNKLNSLYAFLKPISEKGTNIKMILDMALQSGANDKSVEELIEHLKKVLKSEFPNTVVGITPYMKTDSNNNPHHIHLVVLLETSTVGKNTPQKNIENIKIDLSNPNLTMKSVISEKLKQIVDIVQKYSDQNQAVTVNFNIIPPKHSMESFLGAITGVMVPSITSAFCNSDTRWKINSNSDLEGYLIDVLLSMTFVQKSVRSRSKECQENLIIDISAQGSRLDAEIDRILPTLFVSINNNLDRGNTQILNFKFTVRAPPDLENYLTQLASSLQNIIRNYFPYNSLRLRTGVQQNGMYAVVDISITLEPDTKPLPESSITIPINSVQLGSVSVYLKSAVNSYMTQIQALLAQNSDFTLGFQINPPAGSRDNYFQKVPQEMFSVMQQLFPNHSFKMYSKGSKNSKGEYFMIQVVFIIG